MDVLAGPFAIVALVLAVGGAFKLRDPAPTATMLGSLGLPPSPLVARASGALEVSVGLAAALVGGRVLAAAVVVLYAVFALMTAELVRRGDRAVSCGCFGRLSSAATGVHVAANVIAAAVAAAAIVVDVPGFVDLRADQPAGGLVYVGLAVLGAWLWVAAITVLPDTMVAAQRVPRSPSVRTFEIESFDVRAARR